MKPYGSDNRSGVYLAYLAFYTLGKTAGGRQGKEWKDGLNWG